MPYDLWSMLLSIHLVVSKLPPALPLGSYIDQRTAYRLTGIYAEAPVTGDCSVCGRRQPDWRIDMQRLVVIPTSLEPRLPQCGENLRQKETYDDSLDW
jgi:hypothetical protein